MSSFIWILVSVFFGLRWSGSKTSASIAEILSSITDTPLSFSRLSFTHSAKYEWKIVKLKEVEVISYDTIRQIFDGQLARATGEEEYLQQVLQQIQVVKQCIDIVYKNAALFSGMKLLGRSDRLFYFPEAAQQGFRNSGLLSREVLRNCTNPQAQAIYAGLKTAIQINRRGGVYFVGKN